MLARPVTETEEPAAAAAVSTDAPSKAGLLLPAWSLGQRELVRFLRQRHRIVGALATPIVFWLLIGGGMHTSFTGPGMPGGGSYIQYFFPGTVLMILLFTAIFSTISIIEDRREGFLQSVLVAPVPREAIVLGKVLGGTALAFGQGLIFLLLAPLVGIHLTLISFALSLLVMLIVSFALTALGVCIAWRMDSTQGFHAIMNLFLLPLWFLSGAMFPPDNAMRGLKWLMLVNPLTYGMNALQRALYWGQGVHTEHSLLPGFWISVTISLAFALVMFLLASTIVARRNAADWQ